MSYMPTEKIQNWTNYVSSDSSTGEAISSAVEYYKATEVTYTPATNASLVIVEANLSMVYTPHNSASLMNTRLQESTDGGSSWSDIDGCRLFEGTEGPTDYDAWFMNWIFSLAPWSGSRKLRLAGRSKNHIDNEYTINKSFDFGSNSAEDTLPMLSIYSVM